jgi:hypothetical protein
LGGRKEGLGCTRGRALLGRRGCGSVGLSFCGMAGYTAVTQQLQVLYLVPHVHGNLLAKNSRQNFLNLKMKFGGEDKTKVKNPKSRRSPSPKKSFALRDPALRDPSLCGILLCGILRFGESSALGEPSLTGTRDSDRPSGENPFVNREKSLIGGSLIKCLTVVMLPELTSSLRRIVSMTS